MRSIRFFWMMAVGVVLGAGVVRADLPMYVQGQLTGVPVYSQPLTVVNGGVERTVYVPLPVGSVAQPVRLNLSPRTWLTPTVPKTGSGLIPTDIRARVELIPLDVRVQLNLLGR